jgi:LacI family transcriptional regulator
MTHNLEDIAELAGVSRSTVSRVINNHPHVSERTRRRVMQIIEEQKFQPNRAARALATKNSRVLSVVIPQAISSTFTDPYFPTLIQGITFAANQHDYAVMLWIGNDAEEEERLYDRILAHSLFDGLLISSVVDDDPIISWLIDAQFPFLLVGPPLVEGMNYVDVNNYESARNAVSHLIRLGRKRIGTITGQLNMRAARHRLEGYQQALNDARLPADSNFIYEGNYQEKSGYVGMTQLLRHKVDAVFAANDVMALGAIRAIQDHGLCVPNDVSVVGYDDLPISATSAPTLTTVRQPIQEIGSTAVQGIIGLLEGSLKTPFQKILSAHLVVRESCGAKGRHKGGDVYS